MSPKAIVISKYNSLSKKVLISIIVDLTKNLKDSTSNLNKKLEEATLKIIDLEARLSKNSKNSGKPPSSDYSNCPKKKTKSLRDLFLFKKKKKVGGQKDHKGQTLELSTNPDYVIKDEIFNCHICNHDISNIVPEVKKRQVFDIPKISINITEYQIEKKICPSCNYETAGNFPEHVTHKTQYGKNTQVLSTYMNQYQMIPFKRMGEFFADFFGHKINESTFVSMNKRLYTSLEPFENEVSGNLCNSSDAVHFDESGMRVGGKRHWLHVASTSLLTLFRIHKKRGSEAIDAMNILPNFKGNAVHDYWKPYLSYENCFHILCNVHHLRDLVFLYEQYGQKWAKNMIRFLLAVKRLVNYAKTQNLTSLPPPLIQKIEERYWSILKQGKKEIDILPVPEQKKRGRKKKHTAANLHERFERHLDNILTFAHDLNMPFGNNQAEIDIRMAKLKQKISGTFRSVQGADYFARIRSYINTSRKNSINVADALLAACNGNPFIPEIPQIAK